MKRIFILCWMGVSVAASGQQPPPGNFTARWRQIEEINPNYDWTRHFRIGALVGMNIKASFQMSGDFNVSGNSAANGIYNDGYVRRDNTGDPGNLTYYWGYDNATQYDPVNQTLTLHSATSFSPVGDGSASGSDAPYLGFDLAYGDSYWYWGGAKIGWEFGFGLLPIHIANSESMPVTASQTAYTFDVKNPYGAPIPGAPYQGGPNGPGYRISDSWTSSSTTPSIPGTITGTQAMDVMLYTFRLGPSLYWDLGRRCGLFASAGPALGVVSGELDYNESLKLEDGTSAHNAGHIGATDMVFGGYVNATLVFHAQGNADFYAGVQYMPMGNAGISGAGREGNLKLGGQIYITAGINWPF
jgi:hypothetical protein